MYEPFLKQFLLTFQCKHLSGFGFSRGGYRCKCRSGYRYPNDIEQPYWGANIEQSTLTEYREGFNCSPVDREYRSIYTFMGSLDECTHIDSKYW